MLVLAFLCAVLITTVIYFVSFGQLKTRALGALKSMEKLVFYRATLDFLNIIYLDLIVALFVAGLSIRTTKDGEPVPEANVANALFLVVLFPCLTFGLTMYLRMKLNLKL